MADIKTLLKEARKHIDDKNFKEAQECCKSILRKDKQNYFGLVLLGKSLQDSDQAPLAYRKAIESKPEQPLAWLGLAHYYETKNDDSAKLKLFSIYRELLKIQIEEEKSLEILSRLCVLGSAQKNSEAINILSDYIMKNDLPSNLRKVAEEQLVIALKSEVPCNETDINSILTILNRLCAGDPNEQLQLLYCKILIQKKDIFGAVEDILKLNFFSQNLFIKEWLCKQLCTKFVENNMSFEGFIIETHIDCIIDNVANSKYPNLLRSMLSFDKGQYLEAYKQCVPLINYQSPDAIEAIFVIKCTMMLKKWPITQKLAVNFLTKVHNSDLSIQLHKYLFYALAKQQKWDEAITESKKVPIDNMTPSEQALLAGCYIEINSPSESLTELLKPTEYHMHLQTKLLIKQQRYEDVVNLLQHSAYDAQSAYCLGKAFWELKEYDKCLINLLKSAKLNPDHPDTFLYLGHVYYYLKDDLDKAKRCYEKAYNLNNLDSNIAKNLSKIYIKLKQNNANFELLRNFAKDMSQNEIWVYFRLGLHYLNQREWENAIINFRNVIKTNSNETTAFECLADAYYGRGSFTSALRAYHRVMSIDSKKTAHCLTRIGYIYSLLTQYEEAITTFDKVLEIEPYSYIALKGIAETWMRIAKKKLISKIYGSARDCAQKSINYILRALSKQNNFICFWKLLGDILLFITELPNKYAYVHMPQLERGANSEVLKKDKLDIFPEAIICYSYITKQKQQIASYDLASIYLSYYNETKKEVICHIAYNLAITCLQEKPLLWYNWNLLGKICLVIKKYNLAQHCFIKALLTTRKWSVAKIWCNLGTLYLKLKVYKLANYCFSRGQSTMPSYPQSWIGQGLIAEAIREDEAMDLFRHASRLGYHPESALGYGDWVCRTLKNNKYNEDTDLKYVIEGLFAIPYATDLLEWFCNFETENACAFTILGILQERSGLINAALKSYGKALQYADECKKNIALLNVGRILNRTGHYDSAIKVYKSITEASINSTTGLALALVKKGLYEEAYSAYDTALHWLSDDDDEKSDLLVAMAGTVYKFKGVNEAKTLLFHSIQISQKKPTATSLFAICSLGLLHADKSLSKLALSELRKYKTEIHYEFDIGFLKSFLHVSEDNMEEAYKLLSDSLHDHPNSPLLWFCMAQYCLMDNNLRAKVASRCAQKALCSARETKKTDNCNFAKIIATASIAEHIAGNRIKSLMLAKDGLHMYPSQVEIWAALLRSLLSHKMSIERKPWILGMIEHMRKHLDASRRLVKWITMIEKKLCR